eukprot:Nitzschia sp. Nitz4//scaffold197_size40390//24644//25588//NITZ4_007518-RA/size40390-processed-gene-0.5-mRNA-1//1//CDS//3329540487//3784//frame0
MKHCLVAGGSGFVGKALCTKLVQKGYRVTVLSRSPLRVAEEFENLTNTVTDISAGPVECVGAVSELSDRPQSLINLAGAPMVQGRWNDQRKEVLRDSRIGYTERLFEDLKKADMIPERLIGASAIGYYGPHEDGDDEPLCETSDSIIDSFSHQICKDWEAKHDAFASAGTMVSCVRIGLVLEQGGGALEPMLPPFRLGLGGPIGSGKQWFSWIHRDDLVNMICWILEDPSRTGIYNGTAPGVVTNGEFSKELGAALGRPAILPVPAFAMRLAMGEMADELLLKGQRVEPCRSLEEGFQFQYPDLKSALRACVGE